MGISIGIDVPVYPRPHEPVTREYDGQRGDARGERPGRGKENRDDHRGRGKKDRKGDQ